MTDKQIKDTVFDLTDTIYDTLFDNKQYEQFNTLKIDNQFVNSGTGKIHFDTKIDDAVYSVELTLKITDVCESAEKE